MIIETDTARCLPKIQLLSFSLADIIVWYVYVHSYKKNLSLPSFQIGWSCDTVPAYEK